MKKPIVLSALLFLFSAPAWSAARLDPALRLAVMPMAGLVGLKPGAGVDVDMGQRRNAEWP